MTLKDYPKLNNRDMLAPMSFADLAALETALLPIAVAAGKAILAFDPGTADSRIKSDGSPVTEADLAAEAVILAALPRLTPDIPIISEETHAAGKSPHMAPSSFWCVDPLDGTRAFRSGSPDYAVSIALILDRQPVLGILHGPRTGEIYTGYRGGGARSFMGEGDGQAISIRPPPAEGLTVLTSVTTASGSRVLDYLATQSVARHDMLHSALKFGRIAKGAADLYPRFGRTMEWDTAAGQAILEAAGGSVRTIDGAPLRYGKPGYENPHFIAKGHEANP
jgi:3'(2'), 5'-bisphosphate nucleotidase